MKNDNGQNKRHFENAENARHGEGYGPVHQVQEREQHDHERYDHSREHVQQAAQQAERRGEQHQHHAEHLKQNEIAIFIDQKPYHIKDPRITAADVRKLSVPPIGDDKDIFHVVAGAESVKMSDTDVIDVNMHEKERGRHFVSALKPSAIASRHDELAKKAYFNYLKHGCQHGHDVTDWLEAEAESKK